MVAYICLTKAHDYLKVEKCAGSLNRKGMVGLTGSQLIAPLGF